MQRARRGDLKAFDELVAKHERRVWSLAYRITGNAEDAREVAQEAFLRVYRHLRGYDPSRPFESWLYRITVNCTYDYIRRRPGHVSLDGMSGEHDPRLTAAGSDRATRSLESRDLREALQQSLGCLTPQERTVFILRDVEQMETKEIAYILRCTRITVRRHSSNARLKLRRALGAQFAPGAAGGDEEDA